MTIARRLARQLANPAGLAGKLLGSAMDVVNRRPMRLAVNLLDPLAGEHVLDAGCGAGAAMAAILAHAPCRVTGADRSATMIEAARQRVGTRATCLASGIETIPLAAASVDAGLALNVLYFESPDHAMLRSLHRLLRPGGRLVAYVTHGESMRDWAFVREGLHRLYDADQLRSAFVDAGFAADGVEVHEVPVTRTVRGLLARAWR